MSSIDTPLQMQAAMTKGRRRFNKWQKKWWTLKGHHLYSYNSADDSTPRSVINLHNRGTNISSMRSGSKFLIVIESEKRTDTISCGNEKERDQWLDALERGANFTDKKTREKEKRKVEKARRRKGSPIPVSVIQELPGECISIIKKSNISVELLEENFEILLNILRFRTGYQLVPKNEEKKKPTLSPVSGEPNKELLLGAEELFDPSSPLDKYQNLEEIGKGGYGTVYSCKSVPDKCDIAIKMIPHQTEKQKRTNLKEIALLKFMNHNNIVKLYRSHCVDKTSVWVVMEFMKGGTLSEIVQQIDFGEPQIAYVAREVLQALEYLHSNGLIHRDLKSANIMVTHNAEVKLIDFGLCVDFATGPFCHMAGSPFWMPPEMIRNEQHEFPADVWSFGICMLELANKKAPNRKSSLRAMFVAATGAEIGFEEPEKWSDEFSSFLNCALVHTVEERSTVKELLEHDWLINAASEEEMKEFLTQKSEINESPSSN